MSLSHYSLEVNSYIVYFTFVVIAVTLVSCALIYAMRMLRIKRASVREGSGRTVSGTGRGGRVAYDSSIAHDDTSNKSGNSSGGNSGSKKSSVGSMRIQKPSTSGTKRGGREKDGSTGRSGSSSAGMESKGEWNDGVSQYSASTNSLLIGEAKDDHRTEEMSEQMNRTMRIAFASVLSDGITLVQHAGGKSPCEVKLTLSGRDLQLKGRRFFSKQPLYVDLSEILFIEWGKRTQNFSSEATKDVKDEFCFSLVTADSTLDFQASSKVERDALVQGFMMKVADLKDFGAKA